MGWHLSLGSADVGLVEVLSALVGTASAEAEAIASGSRLPRMAAGLIAGAALGLAGALLQSVARNPLAAPETLGINAGAQLAVVVAAITGAELAGPAGLGAAFLGGAAAAALVLAITAGVGASPARLLVAGVAVALMLSATSATLMLLFEQRTAGLFFWGNGSLIQNGSEGIAAAWPRLLVAAGVALLLARRLDLLALGDEAARSLGVRVRPLQLGTVVVALFLSATAVTLTGPIGFVGLAAPHVVRLLGLRRHRPLLAGAALWGALLLVAADALIRQVQDPGVSGELPAGVATALLGAPLFIWLARRFASAPTGVPTVQRATARSPRVPYPWVMAAALGAVSAAVLAALLLGDVAVSWADLAAVALGNAPDLVGGVVVEMRLPRAVVAALAGAFLALSGALLQAVTRNPLAAPSVLGITGGAGVGALTLLLALPGVPAGMVPLGAFAGALLATATVYLLAWRHGSSGGGLVLVGVAVSAFAAAITSALIVGADVRTAQALTWLAGSVYARTWTHAAVLAAGAALLLPAVWLAARRLDLLALGNDLPRTLGLPLERARASLVLLAVLLAGTAVSIVGAISFVGLVAPHAARLLAGSRHRRLLPLAAALGAGLVVSADVIGRTIIAPAQVPAGLLTALIGAPYFIWLLWRTGRVRQP